MSLKNAWAGGADVIGWAVLLAFSARTLANVNEPLQTSYQILWKKIIHFL
jgi:hypothetical protein